MPRYKYIFIDLDGTLCESKQNVKLDMLRELEHINESRRIFIVSGAELSRMLTQAPLKYVTYFSQNGNYQYDGDRVIRENKLTNRDEILKHIHTIALDLKLEITSDMIDDRGSQISFSFVGHNAPFEAKKQYDPDRSRRMEILKKYPFPNALVAGTTCIDYIPKTKGENIEHYLKLRKIKPSDCLYIGDALEEGANDYSVIGVIPTHAVKNPQETLEFLRTLK